MKTTVVYMLHKNKADSWEEQIRVLPYDATMLTKRDPKIYSLTPRFIKREEREERPER